MCTISDSEQYWTAWGREVAKHVIHLCIVCVKSVEKPFVSVPESCLPKERVEDVPTFTN